MCRRPKPLLLLQQ